MSWSRQIGQAFPAVRRRPVGVHRGDRPGRSFAANRHEPARDGSRSGATTRFRQRCHCAPAAVQDLHRGLIRVDAAEPSRDGVDLAAESSRREMFPRRWSLDRAPTFLAKIEHERDARKTAGTTDAPDDIEPVARNFSACGSAGRWQRRKAAPAAFCKDERRPAGWPRAAVSADDVQAPTVGGRHRMVHRGRKVRTPAPATCRRREHVDAARRRPILVVATDDVDVPPNCRAGDLGAWHGQRWTTLPHGRSRE